MAKKSMVAKQKRKAKFSTREYSRCRICGRPHAYLRKYGSCKHAGFGLGFERAIMYLTGMQNIRDVIPFPRTPNNCEF